MGCLKLNYCSDATLPKVMYGKSVLSKKNVQIWIIVDPLSDKYPNTSPYAYCRNNPVILIDPNGMSDDNYTITSDGVIYKEETNDKTNTYTYVNTNTNEVVDLGTYDKTTNSKGEDMVKIGNGSDGENNIFKWKSIISGNLYFEEDALAGLLGGIQNFYDNAGQDVEKVQINQLMSLEHFHSNKGNRKSAIDVAFYRNDGTTGAHTTDKNISDNLNTKLLTSFKAFGLGSKAVFTSNSALSKTPYLSGTTGWPGHHHHFHFDGFKKTLGIQLKTITVFGKK